MLCNLLVIVAIPMPGGSYKEVNLELYKNDDYGVPHDKFNKKHASDQEDSLHLPDFCNKINLFESISPRALPPPKVERDGTYICL